MTLQQLRYFATIARTGSFRVAAGELFVSQPTLSQQINVLEKELGAPLLNRSGAHVTITPFGERVLRFVQLVLQYEEAILREAQAVRRRQQLRIGAVLAGITSILPQALELFRETFSEVKVSIKQGGSLEIVQALSEGQLDFGLVTDSKVISVGKALVKRAVTSGRLVLCVPGDVSASPDALLGRLSDFPFIMLPEGFLLHHVAKLYLDRYPCRTTIHTSSVHAAADLVRRGIGVSILPEWLVAHRDGDARHRTLPLNLGSDEPVMWDCTLVWSQDRVLNAVDERIISAIDEVARRGNPFQESPAPESCAPEWVAPSLETG